MTGPATREGATKLGAAPLIHPGASVEGGALGAYVEIGEGARLNEVEMGDYSYTDRFADLAYAVVGRFVNIASFARVNPGNHPTWRASLHHFMYRASYYWPDAEDEAEFFEWRRQSLCGIGHDSWIGHGAVVLPGRSIGIGAVIGASSVVTKDVAPYQIVAGNPAVPIRPRFPAAIVERLLRLGWWDWDHARLRAALPDFRALPVEAFLEKHES